MHSDQWSELPESFVNHLDLESRLASKLTGAVIEDAAHELGTEPESIIDLGSGTGDGTLALARRFPSARINALDVSAQLLGRVTDAASKAGAAGRITATEVDLDSNWTTHLSEPVDLAWAALSLHHAQDPARLARQVFSVLRPGGVFAITELSDSLTITPDDLGVGVPGLAERISAAISTARPNHATNWPQVLIDAGFHLSPPTDRELTVSGSNAEGARYLADLLDGHAQHLAEQLSAQDLRAVDVAVDKLKAGTSPIELSSRRDVLIATRPRERVDVIVIGGGAAGLASAVALGRSLRSVIVVDSGHPRNAPAAGAHNVLGNEGISPAELLRRGRAEARSYGVRILDGQVSAISGTIDDFTVQVQDTERRLHARRIILATGLVDGLPDIPGLEQGWGHSVLHCPFCHGWEVRGKRIAIIATTEMFLHQTVLFRQLSDRVTVFLHELQDLTDTQSAQLDALGVTSVRRRIRRLVMDGDQVTGVETEDGAVHGADVAVVAPEFNARTSLFEGLGATAETSPFGRHIPSDPQEKTTVPGVWAAGNANQPMSMVVGAAAAGVMTGAAVHGDLAFADLEGAVAGKADK